jgi:hypothetical protein
MKKSARLISLLIAMPFVVHADSLVVGKDEQGVKIRILAVDGKAVSGEPVRLSPGTHKLAVACIKTEAYGALSVDTILVLTVNPNCDYELLGFFEGKNAKVAVKEKAGR